MARDRKRSKQRRERSRASVARGQRPAGGESNGAPLSQPTRADLPGSLEHVGEVDEFDAALIKGAGGVPAEEPRAAEVAEAAAEDELQTPSGLQPAAAAATVARPSGAPIREGNRAMGFLRASWAELQRVQWPDRRQVTQATAVVLGFVALAGAYLGLADFVAKEIVEIIL